MHALERAHSMPLKNLETGLTESSTIRVEVDYKEDNSENGPPTFWILR